MDRTNWKYGKRHINILTVGIVVNKIAVPIAWKLLPQKTKRGNPNTKQRIAIMQKLLLLMEAEDIQVLTMNREFGGEKWLNYLGTKSIGYVVRIKSNTIAGGRRACEYGTTRKKKRGHTKEPVPTRARRDTAANQQSAPSIKTTARIWRLAQIAIFSLKFCRVV